MPADFGRRRDMQRHHGEDRGSQDSGLCPPYGNQERAAEVEHGDRGQRKRQRDQADYRTGMPGQPLDGLDGIDEERWMVVPVGRDVVGRDVASPEIGVGAGARLARESGHRQTGCHVLRDRPCAEIEIVRQKPAARGEDIVHFAAVEETIESRESDQQGDDEHQSKGPRCPVAHARVYAGVTPILPALRDRIRPGVRVLFVGINPGVRSALTGHHFAGFSNRFWKLLYDSRLVPEPIGYEDDDRLPAFGYGITNIVARATPGINDLRAEEYQRGARRLLEKIKTYQPSIVALVGVTVYRALLVSLEDRQAMKRAITLGPQKPPVPFPA